MHKYMVEYEEKKQQLKAREAVTIANYEPKKYRTPDGYTCDIAVFTITTEKVSENAPAKRTLKVMLIQRTELDAEGNGNIEALKWALPGGFIKPTEKGYEAAKRELEEETNVKDIHIQHVGVYDQMGRDVRGWVISNAFYAVVPEEYLEMRQARDDALNVELFNIEEVFSLPLAFDHEQIIKKAIRSIERDMLQSDVAKNFLGNVFTLSELRDVLLTVSSHKQIKEKAAFFRKAPTLPFIEVARGHDGEVLMTDRNSKRPSKLYRFVRADVCASIYF